VHLGCAGARHDQRLGAAARQRHVDITQLEHGQALRVVFLRLLLPCTVASFGTSMLAFAISCSAVFCRVAIGLISYSKVFFFPVRSGKGRRGKLLGARFER
jgi:hypothetical protein